MSQSRDLPKNPLTRDGVSQRQRQTPALSTDFVQIDERDRADFLVLAYRLSEKINYYTADEPPLRNASLANSSLANSHHSASASINPSSSHTPNGSTPNGSTPNGKTSNGKTSNGKTSNSNTPPTVSTQLQAKGTWQDFFEGNTPVQIALISKTQTQAVKTCYADLLERFLAERTCKHLVSILRLWKKRILKPLKKWYEQLDPYTPLRSTIKGLVNTNLGEPLVRMQALEMACKTETTGTENFYDQFIQLFGLKLDSDLTRNQPIPDLANPTIRSELDLIFQALFQVYRQIIRQAPNYLDASLSDRHDHPPHLSLYFAFLETLQPARDDLNRMTQRHLDFFYRKVLALPDRPAQPDHAHLLFELAKPQKEYELSAGTRFKAGKDATGVELFYALDQAVVIHKAKIASLRGLFLNSQEFLNGDKPTNILGLFSSPIANSADGKGKDFPKEQAVKAWLPFGGRTVLDPQVLQPNQVLQGDPAQLGVAIASDVLLLQEGQRIIQVKLSLTGIFPTLPAAKLHEAFEVYLSGEKEWILARAKTLDEERLPARILPNGEPASHTGEGTPEETKWDGADLYLVIELAADVDPVLPYDPNAPIPYDPKVPNLPLSLDRPMPVMRLQLTSKALDDQGRSAYHYFKNAVLQDITITTRVPEVRNVIVQNDLGPLDPTRPFQPFGIRPTTGSTFYLGSREVFQKHLALLKVNVEWEGLPAGADFVNHYRGYYADDECVVNTPNGGCVKASDYFKNLSATVERRTKRTWSTTGLQSSTYNLFTPANEGTLINKLALQEPVLGEPIDTLTEFNPQVSSGFLRFVLNQDFLHDQFAGQFALQTLAAAKDFENKDYVNGAVYELSNDKSLKRWNPSVTFDATVAPVPINEPYTPTIRSLYLSYTAQAGKADCHLFRLYPFGGFDRWQDSQNPAYLFSHFTNEGELLIGIQDLEPPTALPLLFQVAEETADTSLRRTDDVKPSWFYLKDNRWESLNDRISQDATNGLITSGIINLGIPEDISNTNTILDPSLYWIKVNVPARSRTVCNIIGVHPQAARVTFADGNNDPNRLATPLPSGTIAKLENPQPEIKVIEQPYDSFGGRVKEPPEQFYIRISEQLRHKGRAVTIFDYERLVLEKFPEIYKVRCINHGQFDDPTNQLYELAPGTVTLAVIPDLSQRHTTDDLEPKVNINLLQTIEEYLASLSSSWASIKVVNPQYERIQVAFQVKFRSPYDANFGFYRRKLERAIIGFLTPWTVDQASDIHFGGKVYRSAILNFVEEQDYVDYVVNFQMNHDGQEDVREAIASTARSVLTSVPFETNQSHRIEEFKETTPIAANQKLESGVLGYESLDELELGE